MLIKENETEQNKSPQTTITEFFKQISTVPKDSMNPERKREELRSAIRDYFPP